MSEFDRMADSSQFIFTGRLEKVLPGKNYQSNPGAPVALVQVDDVIRVPGGFGRITGSNIELILKEPIDQDRYLFLANISAVSNILTLVENAHADATEKSLVEVRETLSRGFQFRISEHIVSASLVALGSIENVVRLANDHSLPDDDSITWAIASFKIEKVLKGDQKNGTVRLAGPALPSRALPFTPVLRPLARVILILSQLPENIKIPAEIKRGKELFIAHTSDVQPYEKLSEFVQIINNL